MSDKRQRLPHSPVPYLFIAPQILIVLIFFFWPAAQALYLSFMLEDPWGLSSQFVGFENYRILFNDPEYLGTFVFTMVYSALVSFFSLAIALLLAVKANNIVRGQSPYRVLLTWVYAIAPAVAGITAYFIFNRQVGVLSGLFNDLGWDFAPETDGFDASVMLILVSVWKQIPVNFVFFLAGLQGIPKSIREAAHIDCENPQRRFWTITFPLLAPTAFFLLVINVTYAFFETFGLIDTLTQGRPGGSTTTLVYKVYQDGFLGADLGLSSAQSVVLMLLVLALTVVQFRFIERKIHY
ncbi:ABC transporter permease subunit [Saccharospirillum salsuginis]|uniref:sn-glycerol-3-phosphate transport system permease protein UgpA n=1 Tax=Saccharospirillum salsuginis TaxID=418750 RepID=A0A918K413_9GAMM|nr:ABC transporter permease subunit [Saccharospirillum salsuginis]GGX47948.1 glycerol-3-phosphate transporter permease [Saccharospirillum salsuginis]